MRTRSVILAVSAVAALVLAACGDSSDSADGAGARASSSSPSPSGDPSAPGTVPVSGEDLDALLTASGGASAARGAGLDAPPGDPARQPFDGLGETAIAITAPDGSVTGWCVLVAASDEQRMRGLMGVTDLRGYTGMVFVFSSDTGVGFYMRNTPMPLSIGWFDDGGELVATADMDPCRDSPDCYTYNPGTTYRFALEVPQGRLDDLGATDGSRLAVGGPCRDP